MPRFRERSRRGTSGGCEPPEGSLSLEQVRQIVADAVLPPHFFLDKTLNLEWEHVAAEESPWEIVQGRLLDKAYATERRSFEAWNIFLVDGAGRSAEPLLSLKLDAGAGQLHVTRAIHCYAWEGYDAGDHTFLSREVAKWARELVGTIHLARLTSLDDLHDEIICQLFHAVVGASRLPLTSVEAPLPAFSLGQLAYFYRPNPAAAEAASGPLGSWRDLVQQVLNDQLAPVEQAKLLETLLNVTPWEELRELADLFMARWRTLPIASQDLLDLLRTLFNEAALSPYTDLVDKTLVFLRLLGERQYLTSADIADFLGHLLGQLSRHLTAYDLVTFHHRGANYPDALLLDAALKSYLALAEFQPALWGESASDTEHERREKRLRRRALRQAWLIRRRYEGHLVPDAPTSPGENARILPPPPRTPGRVPEEQIYSPHRRTRRLYAGDPLDRHLRDRTREILRQSIQDLHHPEELRELGMAIFLDRPLGAGKRPLEPDQTLLLSYLAFSRSIARQRLQFLAENLGLIPDRAEYDAYRHTLDSDLEVNGIFMDVVAGTSRPGGVSLTDARKAADDFIFLRNTSRAISDFFDQYPIGPLLHRFSLEELNWSAAVLILRSGSTNQAELTIYDHQLRKRVELDFDPGLGYACRGGIEYPLSPLRILRVWEETGDGGALRECDLSAEPILLPPKG